GAVAVGYSLVAFELSAANASPMPDPYLRISNHSYFLWGTLFYGPVLVGGWLLAAGVLYLLASAFKSAPRFDEVLRWSALAVGAGTLGTLVPDLVTSPLRAIGVIDEQAWERSMVAHGGWFAFTWITLIIYVALFFVAYPVAARHGARLRAWKASVA